MASRFIVGLDIGTTAIKAVVAEVHEGRLVGRSFLKEPSAGMRKGAVVEVTETAQAVSRVINEIKRVHKNALKNIYVNVGTAQVKVQSSRGIVAVSRADTEIYQEDIDRAVKAAQALNLGPNRMIIHNVIREFIIDGVSDVLEPLGLSGNRLEVNSLIVDAFSPHVKSIMRAIELAGAEVGGLVFSPLAASRCTLSRRQKDLGVVLIDLGAGSTGMSVYEENKLIGIGKFPVGSAHISNDIAIGLQVPVPVAEEIKLRYGTASVKDVNARETIDLRKLHPDVKSPVSRRFIADIIESRLAEILEFVNNELKLIGKAGQLAGGAVVVGGGAKLHGVTNFIKSELKLTTQIGSPLAEEWAVETGDFSGILNDPEFVVALGLVLWAHDQEGGGRRSRLPRLNFRDIARYFLP